MQYDMSYRGKLCNMKKYRPIWDIPILYHFTSYKPFNLLQWILLVVAYSLWRMLSRWGAVIMSYIRTSPSSSACSIPCSSFFYYMSDQFGMTSRSSNNINTKRSYTLLNIKQREWQIWSLQIYIKSTIITLYVCEWSPIPFKT